MPPQVSVCIPAYNYGHYLPEAIESVLAQTFTDWELIICDDQSVDDTENICREYSDKDPRIRYFKNETRLGMFENFNRTIDHAQAPFVKFLCADDWLHPDCLEVCINLAETFPTASMIQSACVDVNSAGIPISNVSETCFPKKIYKGATLIQRQLLGFKGIGGNSSFFIRKKSLLEIGKYTSRFRYAADTFLGLQLCQVGDFVATNQLLFFGRMHGEERLYTEDLKGSEISHRSEENMAPLIDWISIPRIIFKSSPLFGNNWACMMIGIGRVGADYFLVAILRILQGNVKIGAMYIKEIFRHGKPWWPILAALPWRLIYLLWKRINRKFQKIQQTEVWRPPGFQITQNEKTHKDSTQMP